MRVRAIDTFRGLSIALMVFFIMVSWFGVELPDILRHNVPDSLHPADFVLSLLLFASGMSLVHFHRKHEDAKASAYALDFIERLGKLAFVWLFLSPLTAGFLGMDEIMLNALLSIPLILLVRFPDKVLAMAAAIPVLGYIALLYLGALPAFDDGYLGGYAAAPFYFPVMLAGAIAGKRPDDLRKILAGAIMASVLLLMVVPPHKMSLSPSFMALSVAVSLVLFIMLRTLEFGPLVYLGRNPLRLWALAFVILLVPLDLFVIYGMGAKMPDIAWVNAVVFSAASLAYLYLASKAIDRAAAWWPRAQAGKAGWDADMKNCPVRP